MRENEMNSKENLGAVTIDGIDHIKLKIRNIDGEGVLFSQDGRMIGHQIAGMGFYYYVGHVPNRVKMYRATFLVDEMKSDVPSGHK